MSSSSKDSTTWDGSARTSSSSRRRQAHDVPDEWDAAPDEGEADPKTVWEEANTKEPMPEILVAASSTTSTVPPPSTAFAPTLKILKRPQSQSPKPSGAVTPRKTIAEREAEYKAARERIFAAGKPDVFPDTPVPSDKPPQKVRTERTDVLRQPLGPSSSSGKGFDSRRPQSGMSSPASGASSPRRTPVQGGESTQPIPESSHTNAEADTTDDV